MQAVSVDKLQHAGAEFAFDHLTGIFLRHFEPFFTTGAIEVKTQVFDLGIAQRQREGLAAFLAVEPLAQILSIDSQTFATMRAANVITARLSIQATINLLERLKGRNLHAFEFQFFVEQRAAIHTTNQVRGHFFVTSGARTARPSWHSSSFNFIRKTMISANRKVYRRDVDVTRDYEQF